MDKLQKIMLFVETIAVGSFGIIFYFLLTIDLLAKYSTEMGFLFVYFFGGMGSFYFCRELYGWLISADR